MTDKGSYVSVPANPRLYELLLTYGGQPDLTAEAWYSRAVATELKRMQLLNRTDCVITQHSAWEKLLPFQRVGVDVIRQGSILLCDETGLGKTAQAIVGVECSVQHERVLVVCLNTLKYWWQAEYERWSDEHLSTVVMESPTRDAQLASYGKGWLIINYKQLLLVPELRCVKWDWIVCDEGHMLCNRNTQTVRALEALKRENLLIVTATPYGNDPAEVWSLLHLVDPERYTSYWRFFELFVDYKDGFFGGREIKGVKHPDLLKRELAGAMIRRHKIDVYPQLPPKTHQLIPLKMEAVQQAIYRQTAKDLYIQLPDEAKLPITSALAMITRLRQILSTPSVFGLRDTSVKLDYVESFLATYPGKVVVFTIFRGTVKALMERMTASNTTHTVVWGGLTGAEVEAARQAFIKGEARVLIGTIAGAGAGLNLREAGAEVSIFIDRPYNPTKQLQAEDRIYGIGQMKPVLVQDLHCRGTVDTLVQRILERKMVMTESILGQALRDELAKWI